MKRSECIAAMVGCLVGILGSIAVAWYFVDQAGLWIAGISGGVFGLAGGALGQNFIEGIVVTVLCLTGLVFFLMAPIPAPWLRELAVGCCVGGSIGWLSHGSIA